MLEAPPLQHTLETNRETRTKKDGDSQIFSYEKSEDVTGMIPSPPQSSFSHD